MAMSTLKIVLSEPLRRRRTYEPDCRYLPCSAATDRMLYMWGGKLTATTSLQVYDSCLESWKEVLTHGPRPALQGGGASAHSQHYLYIYGGMKVDDTFNGCLQSLDINTATWTDLSEHCPDAPMKKCGCGMIVYENSVIIIGGYGIRNGPIQPGSEWIRDDDYEEDDPNARGWTTEMHKYDLMKGTWSSIVPTGTKPTPCSFFTLTKVDSHRAVQFGGRMEEQLLSDTYVLDLSTMHWSKILHDIKYLWGRCGHSATCLDYGTDRPQLFISGGLDDDDKVLRDVWLLDVQSGTWKKLKSRKKARRNHCAAAFSVCPGITEVVIFGGTSEYPFSLYNIIADTNVIRFERDTSDPQSQWKLIGSANITQIGTSARIREKLTKLNQTLQKISSGNEEAERIAQEAEKNPEGAAGRSQETEKVSHKAEAERRVQKDEKNKLQIEQRVKDIEERLAEMELEERTSTRTKSTTYSHSAHQ